MVKNKKRLRINVGQVLAPRMDLQIIDF